MDRIWQWAWDRHGARYSWAICAISYLAILPTWLFASFVVVAFEESDRYVEAAAVAVVAVLVLAYVVTLPGLAPLAPDFRRLVERVHSRGRVQFRLLGRSAGGRVRTGQ
jgi:hypothetical protein